MPSITINYSAQDGQRFATALGRVLGVGRDATAAECKTFLIQRAQQLVVDIEGGDAQKAAIAAITVTPLGMT